MTQPLKAAQKSSQKVLGFSADDTIPDGDNVSLVRFGEEEEEAEDAAFLKRKRIIQEIVETENTYIDALKTLQIKLNEVLSSQVYLDSPDFPLQEGKTIHSTAGIILGYSSQLSELLQPRLETYSTETCISDVFIRLSAFMKVYTIYIKDYQPFHKNLIPFYSKNSSIFPDSTARMDFESCLIVPVQRIPRYRLLLSDIIKNTDKEHPDHPDLLKALGEIEKVGKYVNNMQSVYDDQDQVIQLFNRFGKQLTDSTGVQTFIRSHRKLLSKGDFVMLTTAHTLRASTTSTSKIGKKNTFKPVKLYLLNDLLLIGSSNDQKVEGSKLHRLLCLWLVEVIKDDELQIMFKEEEETMAILQAETETKRDEWFACIIEAQSLLNKSIIKGNDIETMDSKVHVEGKVAWNRVKVIPAEIAVALAEDQAKLRKQTTYVGLAPVTPEKPKRKMLSRSTSTKFSRVARLSKIPSSACDDLKIDENSKKELKPLKVPRRNTELLPLSSSPRNSIPRSSSNLHIKSPRREMRGSLFVRVLEARKISKRSGGDIKNSFVRLEIMENSCSTKIVKKQVHPVWTENNEFSFVLKPVDDEYHFLNLSLMNQKKASTSTVGDITIKVKSDGSSESRYVDKWFSLKKNGSSPTCEVRIQLRYLNQEDHKNGVDPKGDDVFKEKEATSSLSMSEQRVLDYLLTSGDPFAVQ